jgi:glycosyltransferase involved in cell wall biosynthesis
MNKKTSQLPLVSIVVNVYNEEKNIRKFLRRIIAQDYPKNRIEIIVVDDDSTDKTVSIAKSFKAKVFRSGYKNRERAKSIGIAQAKGEYLLLMDADVFLVSNTYITNCIARLEKYPEAIASQTIRWHYKKEDSLINRYCNLFGINDPLVLFLGKSGTLMKTENTPPFSMKIINEGEKCWVVKFTPEHLPTIGAQGYILRRRALSKIHWKPYFFHLDTAYELVKKGESTFILTTESIYHDYVDSFSEYLSKLMRNIELFHQLRPFRSYTYDINPLRLAKALFFMMSIVYPLYQSIQGYVRLKDRAWFLHPVVCFVVPILYGYCTLKNIFVKS